MHFDRIMQDLVRLVVYANLEDHKYRPNTCQVCCLHKQAGELGWKSELPDVLHLFIAQVCGLLMYCTCTKVFPNHPKLLQPID